MNEGICWNCWFIRIFDAGLCFRGSLFAFRFSLSFVVVLNFSYHRSLTRWFFVKI